MTMVDRKMPETKMPETKMPETKMPETKMPETKMPETTPATFRSAPVNSPPIRSASPVMLRGSDRISPIHTDGQPRMSARPEASFTPDSVLLTTEPPPTVTRPAHQCKLPLVPICELH
jgi:hypothetical protein